MSTSARHLHFVQSTEPLEGGGLGRAALELNGAFLAAGASSRLVTTAADAGASAEGVHCYRRKGPAKLYYAPGLRREAPGLVAAADVLHAHGFYVYPNQVFGMLARRRGKALVCHPHGMFEPWILNRSRLKKRLVHLLFENANFRHARLWRALTEKEADQVRAFGVPGAIVVAPNGIDPAPFEDCGIEAAPKERRRVLFLGRLHPKKGIDLLLEAWHALGGATGGWELVLAGPDEGGYRARIEATLREHGLAEQVSLPGTVTGADKVALLKSADLFVLSSYSEGFSVAILEAMACAVPVLASEACNFPELAGEGGGWLCRAEAAELTARLAEALAATDEERRERGLAARSLVRERYTWRAVARTLIDACDEHCR